MSYIFECVAAIGAKSKYGCGRGICRGLIIKLTIPH